METHCVYTHSCPPHTHICPVSVNTHSLCLHTFTSPPPLRCLQQMLDYNVPGGKLNRGMAVYDVLASIKGAEVRGRERAVAEGAAVAPTSSRQQQQQHHIGTATTGTASEQQQPAVVAGSEGRNSIVLQHSW